MIVAEASLLYKLRIVVTSNSKEGFENLNPLYFEYNGDSVKNDLSMLLETKLTRPVVSRKSELWTNCQTFVATRC